jgi:hypothetical protein
MLLLINRMSTRIEELAKTIIANSPNATRIRGLNILVPQFKGLTLDNLFGTDASQKGLARKEILPVERRVYILLDPSIKIIELIGDKNRQFELARDLYNSSLDAAEDYFGAADKRKRIGLMPNIDSALVYRWPGVLAEMHLTIPMEPRNPTVKEQVRKIASKHFPNHIKKPASYHFRG